LTRFEIEACEKELLIYFLPSCSDLMSLTISPVPGIIMIGKFNQGPASSLRSDPSEARELFLDEQRLDVREHRRFIYKVRKSFLVKNQEIF
jgi:hypothetical protein